MAGALQHLGNLFFGRQDHRHKIGESLFQEQLLQFIRSAGKGNRSHILLERPRFLFFGSQGFGEFIHKFRHHRFSRNRVVAFNNLLLELLIRFSPNRAAEILNSDAGHAIV